MNNMQWNKKTTYRIISIAVTTGLITLAAWSFANRAKNNFGSKLPAMEEIEKMNRNTLEKTQPAVILDKAHKIKLDP